MEKKLASIYLDPSQPASFGGLDAVYRAVKEKGKNKISRKQVRDWLSQQDVYTNWLSQQDVYTNWLSQQDVYTNPREDATSEVESSFLE